MDELAAKHGITNDQASRLIRQIGNDRGKLDVAAGNLTKTTPEQREAKREPARQEASGFSARREGEMWVVSVNVSEEPGAQQAIFVASQEVVERFSEKLAKKLKTPAPFGLDPSHRRTRR